MLIGSPMGAGGFGTLSQHVSDRTVVTYDPRGVERRGRRPAGTRPGVFGMPATDDGSRTDPLLGQNLVTCTHYEPDFDALRSASARIVLAVGGESEGQMANRGAFAVAERLGTKPVMFPSNHGGFLGDEYGQPGQPEAFAAKLREVLADQP